MGRILSGEPDGSFVVRDSSDHHYIFSLTFKLNGFVRHVRIEHDQGNFSFGSFTRFKSTTIVDFIENAVEHSRSGRYLFFLHRRPVLGPMRVQLLHPVSRFKRVQSLQHLCRYVIVKVVRKDHLDQLPVPSRIKKYLNTRFYYTEQVTGNEETSDVPRLWNKSRKMSLIGISVMMSLILTKRLLKMLMMKLSQHELTIHYLLPIIKSLIKFCLMTTSYVLLLYHRLLQTIMNKILHRQKK